MSFIGDLFGFGGDDSAEDAARIQAQAATQTGQLGADAAIRAAQIQAQTSQLGIDELRRQFEATEARFDPFVQAGVRALPGVKGAATIPGFAGRIGQIQNTDIFRDLVDERTRAVRGQLSAGGLTRSGTALNEIADIPTDIALIIEQILAGRGQDLASSGQGAAAGLGGIGSNVSGGIANLLQQSGRAQAQGITGAASATGQALTGAAGATASGILDAQTARASANQNLLNTAATIGSIFFSDPRLKENVEKIGRILNLILYQWDWIPGTRGTIIEHCMNIGFMSNEVLKKYPQHIDDFGGFMTIKLPALLDELEAKIWPLH